jgi:hypothetical protein
MQRRVHAKVQIEVALTGLLGRETLPLLLVTHFEQALPHVQPGPSAKYAAENYLKGAF